MNKDKLEQVMAALESARNVLANSGAESGYCMCGDPVEGHSFGSGHSPVDSHAYMAHQIVEQIDEALRAISETQENKHD